MSTQARMAVSDEVDTPQGFPLAALFQQVRTVTTTGPDRWRIYRASGYGRRVAKLDTAIATADYVTISETELMELVIGVKEWFYWLEAFGENSGVCFGVFDSTFIARPCSLTTTNPGQCVSGL